MKPFFSILKAKRFHPLAELAFFLVIPLPFFYFLFLFFLNVKTLNEKQEYIDALYKKKIQFNKLQEKETQFLQQIKKADHFYIDKYLETLPFLEQETKKLEASAFQMDQEDTALKRLQFLKKGTNNLLFAEEEIRKSAHVQEVEEKQQHPVEIDEEDLKKVLSFVEGIPIGSYTPPSGRPQLIIKNFELLRKETSLEEAIFTLNMNLLKREPKTE